MFKRLRTLCSRLSARTWAMMTVLNIIGSSLTAVVVDLAYQPADTRYYDRHADLYVHVATALVLFVWSFYGLIATAKSNRKGVKAYYNVLIILMVIAILTGIIHLVLLFTLYRNDLIRSCVNDHLPGLFWWSLGYTMDEEVTTLILQCDRAWNKLAIQRTLTWATYSITLIIMTIMMHRYISRWEDPWRLSSSSYDDIVDQEAINEHTLEGKRRIQEVEDKDGGGKPRDDEMGNIQYERRQRLYDEIHHTRTHQSRKQSQNPIHPLDPPPLGSTTQRMAEKMDYDYYREHMMHQKSPSQPPPHDPNMEDVAIEGATSRRRHTSWNLHTGDYHPDVTSQSPLREEEEQEEYHPPSYEHDDAEKKG